MKVALVLLTGPQSSCKLVHAIVFARDINARGGDAKVILEGESPGWLLLLPDPDHTLHGMYTKAKQEGLIDAVCKACAMQAGAVEAAQKEGLTLADQASGHVSLARYVETGYQVVTL
jgi:hypothetical protein